MQTVYNVNYFISKFSAIPEDKWAVGALRNSNGQMCANGHCGAKGGITLGQSAFINTTDESVALQRIFSPLQIPISHGARMAELQGYSAKAASVNNGECSLYPQPTPKQRILAALADAKLLEGQVEISDPPVYVEDLIGEGVEA